MSMNNTTYIKVQVQEYSFETLGSPELGDRKWEPGDNGLAAENYTASVVKKAYRKFLTNRQQLVLKFVLEGKTRREIASFLSISEQAVHQIIPRMRKRLNEKAGISLDGWKRRHGG